MSRKAKTPKALAEILLTKQPEYVAYTEELLRAKKLPFENQAEHVQRLTAEQIVARMDGYNAAVESMIHEANCWGGFMYVGEPRVQQNSDGTKTVSRSGVGVRDPEFREWRRVYFTRGIAGR